VEEQATRGRTPVESGGAYKGRRNWRPFASRAVAIAHEGGFPSRQSLREPPRRRPKSPARAAMSTARIETRIFGVSREPSGEGSFGSLEAGHLTDQRHKHGKLQPTSVAEPVGRPRKRALYDLCWL
jgi:hypothetical protein